MIKTAPDPIDVQDLQFKLHCRLKIFDDEDPTVFSKHCSLVACASRFGLIFVGSNNSSIQAIQIKDIEKYTRSDGDKLNYPRRTLPLTSFPTHLSVNCEHTILAIVIEKDKCPHALFYDVKSFWQQEIVQVGLVRLSATTEVHVTEINWNPALGTIFTACKTDGTLGIYEVKSTGVDINELPAAAGATCFSWSPKGKQISVGTRDGKITQLKPDLKAVKVINAPPLKEPYSVQSLQWVSNYQFIGVFQPINPNGQAVFIVIDAPKTGDPTYINYDDICYSNGNVRPIQFYTILLQSWNILMVASSNSMEVGILGNSGECWTQWIMGDAARAELPLSVSHQETLPIGCALDVGTTQPMPWGESTLPSMPLLLLYSHCGILCFFNVVNLKKGIPNVCTPPDPLTNLTGLQYFIVDTKSTSNINSAAKDLSKVVSLTPPISTVTDKNVATSNYFTMLPQSTLNLSNSQTINLFGGQATLTPITQTMEKLEASFMPQYQSLLPPLTNNEVKNVVTSYVTPVCTTSALITSSVTPEPTVSISTDLIASSTLTFNQSEPKEDSIKTAATQVDLKAEEEAEKIFSQMVKEECVFLESELKAMLHQGKHVKLNFGTDEEKTKIVENTKSLEEFFRDVVEICVSQNAEIHILKQNLLQSWAWYEEAKSRYLASEDESMTLLMRAQPLDSASEKQLADIQHTNYYLESQISQAHLALDEQWENFQDYCKKTHKIQIPTMEMIFQTMVKQNAILRKQNYILKDIASRTKGKFRSALAPPALISMDDIKNLPDELKHLRMSSENICQMHYEHVTQRMKTRNKDNSNNLRIFLKKRQYPHISVIKPQLATSVIQASPSSKVKQHSLFTPGMHGSFSELRRKLDFVEPSSRPVISKSELNVEASTPIKGLQNFTLKFEANNLPNADKTFAPLVKSAIASSPNSAFVSTIFGSNTSTSTAIPSAGKTTFFDVSSTSTTTPSVVKVTPSFVMVTTSALASHPVITISTSDFSKPFSFVSPSSISSQVTATNTSKPSVTAVTSSEGKSTSPFASMAVSTTASLFGTTDVIDKTTASLSKVTAKPSSTSISGFSLTPSTKVASSSTCSTGASVKTVVTSSLIYGTTSISTAASPTIPFSFGTASSSNLFGVTNQKTSDSSMSVVATRPFIFSSKIPACSITTATTQNLFGTKLESTTATSTSQSVIFDTAVAGVNSTKLTNVSLPVTTDSLGKTGISSSSKLSAILSTATASTQASTISLGGIKQSLFTSVVSSTTNTSAFTTTASTLTTVISSTSSAITTPETSSATSKQSVFGSSNIITTNTSPLFSSISTSTTRFPVGTTSAIKPSLLDSGEVDISKSSEINVTAVSLETTVSSATPTTQSSIFGSVPTATSTSFVISSTSNTQSSLFEAAPSTSSADFGTPTASITQQTVFGTLPSAAITLNTPNTTTIQSSIFGAPSSTSPTFGTSVTSAPQSALFGTPTSTFGALVPSTTQSSIFGTSSSTPSIFGTPVSSTKQSSLFGTAVSTPAASIFGTSTTSTTQSVFVSGTTNQTSVFGNVITSPSQQSIFGNPPATTTSQSQSFGVFGDSSHKSSIFGNSVSSSTQSTVFGNNNNGTSVFGNVTSTVISPFGTTSNTFGQSVFGSTGNSFGNSGTFGTSGSTFGQPTGSLFGNAPTTTSGSIFGGAPITGNAFPLAGTTFGTPASTAAPSPFGSGALFSNTTQAGSGSFGFGSLSVSSTATTSSSGFGATQASNLFGGDNKNIFGSSALSSNSPFRSNTGSLFGTSSQSFTGGFGSQSGFGQQPAFGQNSFGSNSFGQALSSGPFSSGSSGTVGQSGFGTGSGFQKSGGFGSPPVFGGSPAFGSAPSFGGSPSFGSSPTFGNTSKIFGSNSSGFGTSPSSQPTGFGNLANQPTVGFGNLAQQASNSTAANAPFSGNSSFSSWR